MEISSARKRRFLIMLQKKLYTVFYKPFLKRYLRKERAYSKDGISVIVKPQVFHPKYFFSSEYLFDFVKKIHLEGKIFSELGCGTGIISLLAWKKGAKVISVDINSLAIENAKINLSRNINIGKPNELPKFILSDIYIEVKDVVFDIIVINPPYFFSDIKDDSQLAWNAGANGEYFLKLFSQLKEKIHKDSKVYMILADNCEIERIKKMASDKGFSMSCIEKKKVKWETNFIFQVIDTTI